ncbi:MAG: glycerate kinase [Desulfarculaceae bacterium]|nr:glycerate kinase [Desulfarculaceae bacterium]MCF8073989.1 glycerate kinase [Desulfarculaceae bacterium]MCF8102675.1 glycerate kinase [Desulfarculaceae bacterium]MCF8116084.1 glycerate kinase [Desulfarculaceae bacterium]
MPSPQLRQDAKEIIDTALAAVDPFRAVSQSLHLEGDTLTIDGEAMDLSRFARIIVVGAGKAGAPMAQAVESVLGDRVGDGRVVVKDGHGGETKIINIDEASHPVPDARGVEAGRSIAALVAEHAAPDTLFLCLLSGGGSALLVAPAEGIALADKQETTRLLLASGADISEINAIRKHLSELKGGNLARLAAPGKVISLIISDVVGDRLDVIASGPTVADLSTWGDCRDILNRYGIWDQAPAPVRQRIEQGLAGELPDTLKPGDSELAGVANLIVSSNRGAVEQAAAKARQLGYASLVLGTTIEGETSPVARMHAALARECQASGQPASPPCCLLSGGETTVTLGSDPGKGGRNMEFALAAALDLDGLEDVLAVSLGTDGTDGPTDAAGAWADGESVARGAAKGLKARDFLTRHDAYNFFQPLDDLIITGPTRTNVMDLRLMLVAGK